MATNANVRLVPKAEVTVLKKSHSPPLEERLLCSASRSSNSVARIFRHSGTGRNGNGIDMDRSGALDVESPPSARAPRYGDPDRAPTPACAFRGRVQNRLWQGLGAERRRCNDQADDA